jgi:diadenosine tetraphosphate (Ap4A) HIT family hydrolase
MDPCYLCEIVAADEAWNVVERSELTLTALNGRQFEVGQCLVFPRRHAPTLLELTASEGSALMMAAQRAAHAMVSAYDVDGVLLYQNNGVGSGQEVPHFHLHVVPRRAGSDWGLGPPHLARFAATGRPEHLDHAIVTKQKLDAVAALERHWP